MMAISDFMPKDPDWYAKMAEFEGDQEIGAGYEIMTPEGAEIFMATVAAMAKFPDKDD